MAGAGGVSRSVQFKSNQCILNKESMKPGKGRSEMALERESPTEPIIRAAIEGHRQLGPGFFKGGLAEGPHHRQDNARTHAGHRSLTFFLHSWFPYCDLSQFSRVRPENPVFVLESAAHSNMSHEPRVGELRPVFNRHASPSLGIQPQLRLSGSFALPGRTPAITAQQELRPPGAYTCNHGSAGLRRAQSSELRPPGIRKGH